MKSEAIVECLDEFVICLDQKHYDRPAQKFAREFLAAMLTSKSTVVSVICRAVTTNQKSFKALYQKFWRRLDELSFSEAKKQQQSRALREIQHDTVIAVDLGDITKPHAKTLECLGRVADGSDGHKIKPGYWTLGAVAVNPKFEEKTPQPLELKVYSASSEGFYSENTIMNEFIADVFQKTGGKGIFTIDRGGDRIRIIQPLCELKGKFVIRLKDRILYDVEGNKSFRLKEHLASRFELPHQVTIERRSKNGKRVPMDLRFSFAKVAIPDLKKKKIAHEMYLVTAWNDKHKRPMELLTTVPVLSERDAISTILNYLSRWSVEETYRFLKTSSNLERVQLRSFGKLQNMVDACFLAASITARMARYSSWQKVFESACRRQTKAPASLYNWMHRAADAISLLLKKFFSEIKKLNSPRPPGFRKSPPRGGLFLVVWGV
ncbi:MAG: transposase [Proteobacteria bacterium]|nr:transposase [Pseudomonadota bacterium]